MIDSHFHENGNSVAGGRTIVPTLTVQPPSAIPVIVAPSSALNTPDVTKLKKHRKSFFEAKKIQITDTMSNRDRLRLCAAEIGGTAILVFVGCMGCVTFDGNPPPHQQISLTFGLAVMMAIQVFGHISGAHINPVVTLAAVTMGYIPIIQVPIYFVGQLLGSILGFGLLRAITPGIYIINPANINDDGICSPVINMKLSYVQAFMVEFLISFILTLVCCGVWDNRNRNKHDSTPLRFGFTIACLAFAAGPYTGANMNPVRSFAPALINGIWENHWLYWTAPLSGGLFGALLYRIVWSKDIEDPERAVIPEAIPLNDKP